ncbi:hypothetical protein ACFYYR_12890 [Streptomyces sp. NPDC001922]|uniref:hypothetical protein n=1 Tax=Streptomyces sp. NPDC001922 TaxID=3364624 RepID=UPI0036999109
MTENDPTFQRPAPVPGPASAPPVVPISAPALAGGLRLLPWPTPDGRPCYLSSDGNGRVAELADRVEEMQLRTGGEILGHARRMLSDPAVPTREFRFLSARLAEALHDALRISESRGMRIGQEGITDGNISRETVYGMRD